MVKEAIVATSSGGSTGIAPPPLGCGYRPDTKTEC